MLAHSLQSQSILTRASLIENCLDPREHATCVLTSATVQTAASPVYKTSSSNPQLCGLLNRMFMQEMADTSHLPQLCQLKVLVDLLPVHHIPPGCDVLHVERLPFKFCKVLAAVPQLCHGDRELPQQSQGENAVRAIVSPCMEALPQGACSGTCTSSAQRLSTWTSS